LKPGLAGALCNAGRDVWIVDLRSSCGLPTGARPWCFEDMAFDDLPLAVDHICRVTGCEQLDALAHCMGAAMLTMALLADRTPRESDAGWALRELLRGRWQIGLDAEGRDRPQGTATTQRAAPGRLRRLVLSQVGPLVVMTPANRARAQLARYVKQFFPVARYEFSPADPGSLLEQAIDRVLATLPYPADEFRAENPLWPPGATAPWSRTRRRIDILYGRVFKLNNLSRATLERLDDFFGPMNVDTLTQAIHFARSRSITDAQGRNMYATLPQLARWLDFPMLSIHGEENGLADPATAQLLRAALDPSRFEARTYRGFGHQDCLIGRDCARIFGDVVGFLGEQT
jgi:pimeloyl-ACP methyl ester carboxylesterase